MNPSKFDRNETNKITVAFSFLHLTFWYHNIIIAVISIDASYFGNTSNGFSEWIDSLVPQIFTSRSQIKTKTHLCSINWATSTIQMVAFYEADKSFHFSSKRNDLFNI